MYNEIRNVKRLKKCSERCNVGALLTPGSAMARPSTISAEEVFAAVAKLVAAGQYPNPTNVRRELDSRGSPPVVQRHIGEWYREFGPELARKAATKPPKSATSGLQAELKRLTEDALKDLEASQLQRKNALDAREAELAARENNLLERENRQNDREIDHQSFISTLEVDLKDARSALGKALSDLNESRAEGQAALTKLAATEATYAATLQQLAMRKERDELQQKELQRLSGVAGELRVARELAEHSRVYASEQAARARTAIAEKEDAMRSLHSVELQYATLSTQLDSARVTMDAARLRADELQSQLDAALADVAQGKKDHAVVSAQLVGMQSLVEALQLQVRQQASEHKANLDFASTSLASLNGIETTLQSLLQAAGASTEPKGSKRK